MFFWFLKCVKPTASFSFTFRWFLHLYVGKHFLMTYFAKMTTFKCFVGWGECQIFECKEVWYAEEIFLKSYKEQGKNHILVVQKNHGPLGNTCSLLEYLVEFSSLHACYHSWQPFPHIFDHIIRSYESASHLLGIPNNPSHRWCCIDMPLRKHAQSMKLGRRNQPQDLTRYHTC